MTTMPTVATDFCCPFCLWPYRNSSAPQSSVDQALAVHIELEHTGAELLAFARQQQHLLRLAQAQNVQQYR